MRPQDLDLVLDWAASEGWNPGLDDAAAFLDADPDGFLMKWVQGRPVAAISVVNHAADHAFLGLYICSPDSRGQGHGMDVWLAGLAHARGRSVGLDGVPAQQANYEVSGFRRAGCTQRLTGTLPVTAGWGMRTPDVQDLAALAARDHWLQGYARPAFLAAWTADCPTRRTLVCGGGTGLAYATGRRCRSGVKIGPLYAPDAATALSLIAVLADGDEVSVDVPEASADLHGALTAEGFTAAFETARMYRGPAPAAQSAPFQAVATLELG
ncbi:MAG: N-acetyltransferase [Rhodobacteraceae bacterium]|nr:N-acetyltransferase [Paracoccaceae bacterium]